MRIICIFLGIGFIMIGFLFSIQKLLPKEWKKMTILEKNKIKIKPLCINIGCMISICGVLFLMRGLWIHFGGKAFNIAIIAWFILSGLDILFISKSKYYLNK